MDLRRSDVNAQCLARQCSKRRSYMPWPSVKSIKKNQCIQGCKVRQFAISLFRSKRCLSVAALIPFFCQQTIKSRIPCNVQVQRVFEKKWPSWKVCGKNNNAKWGGVQRARLNTRCNTVLQDEAKCNVVLKTKTLKWDRSVLNWKQKCWSEVHSFWKDARTRF